MNEFPTGIDMSAEPVIPFPPVDPEYLIVSDTNSEVIKSSNKLGEIRKLANLIRKAGGSVTIFKSTKL